MGITEQNYAQRIAEALEAIAEQLRIANMSPMERTLHEKFRSADGNQSS